MGRRRRLSDESAAVLALFIGEPDRERFGLDIIRATGINSGSLYPILHRLEDDGVLRSEWEPQGDAITARRRPRRLYRLNPEGADLAAERLADWKAARQAGGRHARAPGTAFG